MKQLRLRTVMILVLLSLMSVLVFAQDATQEPMAALPASMESALAPCAADTAGPCDIIATKAEDIVGVWKQYLGGPRFNAPDGMAYIRYNADSTYAIADSVENTAQPYESYPSGTYQFDGTQFIIDPVVGSPCAGSGIFQLRV